MKTAAIAGTVFILAAAAYSRARANGNVSAGAGSRPGLKTNSHVRPLNNRRRGSFSCHLLCYLREMNPCRLLRFPGWP